MGRRILGDVLTLRDLIDEARDLGYTVERARMVHRLGVCDTHQRTIFLDHRLNDERARFILAHELGHARRGHDGHMDKHTENTLDEEAARRIIDPGAYARAEAIWEDDDMRLAEEIETCTEAVRAYRRHLERTGRVRPRTA